ncbi:MAG TPA: GNAT family N-acetyltransferase [Caulobacteraceae bacterium]|nr:GNAT family N-acetyltransferase [Caulobacteraceae bacterium]
MDGLTHPHLYASSLYAEALAHVGEPVRVDAWDSFVIARSLPFGEGLDATGAYPMAVFSPNADLQGGLESLACTGLVSLVLVPDPFASPSPQQLAGAFALCRPFKTHYLVETANGVSFTKHHRDRVRRGARRCRIERVTLADHLAGWGELYAGLADRRAIRGVADFPPAYFARLAQASELVALAAFVDDHLAAMTLWFEHGGVVYNHLTASDAVGYANGANFALYGAAIDVFAGAAMMNLGGGAGFDDDPDDGLAAFKRGFANAETRALICGAILDPRRYAALTAGRPATNFFPAYRG